MKRFATFAALALVLVCSLDSCAHFTKKVAIKALENVATMTNEQLAGRNVDSATMVDSVTFDGHNFNYYYTIDEAAITIESLKAQLPEFKERIDSSWKNDDQLKATGTLLAIIEGEVTYNYTGNTSGEQLNFSIKPERRE